MKKDRREEAIKQLNRMTGLRGFPSGKNNPAFNSLVDAMITAPSLAAMEHFIDGWLHDNDVCPVPKTLYDAFRPPDARSHTDTGCVKCGGNGWIHFTKRVAIGGLASYDADYAKRCDCLIARIEQAGLEL